MSEKKELNYLLRCPECNLALFKSRRISKLPIKQSYHCYGCDKDVNKAIWEDCSNGWMCSKCFHDSTYDYYICPHCGCIMLNGSTGEPRKKPQRITT